MKYLLITILGFVLIQSCHQPQKAVSQAPVIKKDSMPEGTNPTLFHDKFLQGIDFIASGNEPFWSLEIDFDKMMQFKTVDGFELNTPVPEAVKAMDANVTRYAAKTEEGILTVQLAQLECINDMSGAKSDFTVTIDTKKNTDKELRNYKGCGRYLADYRMNDIWVLESINNIPLKRADFRKGLPQLEINLTQKKMFGHTGCNTVNGPIEVLGNKIKFGFLATTKMACNDMDFENRYLTSLSRKTVSYKIEPGKLHLQINADSVFTYKKVD